MAVSSEFSDDELSMEEEDELMEFSVLCLFCEDKFSSVKDAFQ